MVPGPDGKDVKVLAHLVSRGGPFSACGWLAGRGRVHRELCCMHRGGLATRSDGTVQPCRG